MKRILLIFVMTCILLTNLWAGEEGHPMLGFIQGSYIVVGQAPENGKPYNGSMSILMNEDNNLEIIRTINGKTIRCTGKMESALGGEATIFTITFTENETKYKVIYLISSDLDNYARLTGYVFEPEGETEMPGLEALFPDVFGY